MLLIESIAVIVGAYVLGSVPSAFLYARALKGIDLRAHGSGIIGAANFIVLAGWKAALPLLIFDVFVKGMLPVVIASERILGLGIGMEVAAGFASIAGHNWSVFLGFTGGRGMATVLGVIVTLSWPLVILYGSVAGLGWLATRSSAIWWGIAAVMLPMWSELLRRYFASTTDVAPGVTIFCLGFLFITVIKRLIANSNTLSNSQGLPLKQLLWNRLLFDRDVASREEWITRRPKT